MTSLLADSVRRLRAAGVMLSDRRIVRAQNLLTAAAAVAGRDRADERDLWPLLYVLPTASEQLRGRELLRDVLERAENITCRFARAMRVATPMATAV